MNKLKGLFIFICIFYSFTFAKSYSGLKYDVFFGSMGSARAESLGRILSVDEQAFSFVSNPSFLTHQKGLHFDYSNSYYRDKYFDENYYNFSGIKYNYRNHHFGLNFLFINKEMSRITGKDNPNYKIVSFSYARPCFNFIHFGLRTNIFIDDLYKNNRKYGYYTDLGLYRTEQVLNNSRFKDKLQFGLQYSNIFNQSVDLDYSALLFPSILRVGLKNELYYNDNNPDFYSAPYILKVTTAIEYQNVTNSKYFSGLRYGLELGLFDILFGRYGYYRIKQEEHPETLYPEQYRDYISEPTYGFGIKFELQRYFKDLIPLTINIDYTELENPADYKAVDFGDFNILDIGINYTL
ncbi:MAG: hypothetical protein K9M80_01645 [Candidatus Marinimicrobia bacterium]|nr:hypothetical protein [Candidatus Neomarinimicrobiota bacterium]